jgi:hypothetical protein
LLADGVKLINRTVKKVKELGLASKIKFVEHFRVIKKTLLNMTKFKKSSAKGQPQQFAWRRKIISSSQQTLKMAKAVLG